MSNQDNMDEEEVATLVDPEEQYQNEDTDYEGEIKINGNILKSLNNNQLSSLRNRDIGFVFQFQSRPFLPFCFILVLPLPLPRDELRPVEPLRL